MGARMLRKGLAVAVILLFIGVAFTSSINANVSKSSLEPVSNIEVSEDDDATPIVLVFQLIAKLGNHKDIQNVENEDELLQIIESDEELNSIVEKLSAYGDCGCEDDTTPLEWKYPVICLLIFPLTWVALYLYFVGGFSWLAEIVGVIGYTLDCFWFF